MLTSPVSAAPDLGAEQLGHPVSSSCASESAMPSPMKIIGLRAEASIAAIRATACSSGATRVEGITVGRTSSTAGASSTSIGRQT